MTCTQSPQELSFPCRKGAYKRVFGLRVQVCRESCVWSISVATGCRVRELSRVLLAHARDVPTATGHLCNESQLLPGKAGPYCLHVGMSSLLFTRDCEACLDFPAPRDQLARM